MRAIREEAADRLREELDRTSESFLRRADSLIADQLQRAWTRPRSASTIASSSSRAATSRPVPPPASRSAQEQGTRARQQGFRAAWRRRPKPLCGTRTSRRRSSWRLHILLEAGYPVHLAERIAVSEVDLHDAVELISRGCDPTTAAEILL